MREDPNFDWKKVYGTVKGQKADMWVQDDPTPNFWKSDSGDKHMDELINRALEAEEQKKQEKLRKERLEQKRREEQQREKEAAKIAAVMDVDGEYTGENSDRKES